MYKPTNITLLKKPFFNKKIYHNRLFSYLVYFNPSSYKGMILIHKAYKKILIKIDGKKTIEELLKYCSDQTERNNLLTTLNKLNNYHIISFEKPIDGKLIQKPGLKKIMDVWIDVTNQCNFRCRYCFTNKNQKHLTIKEGKKIIYQLLTEAKKNNCKLLLIKFSGGEPLLELETIIALKKYATNLLHIFNIPIQVVLITNGSLLTDKTVSLLKDNGIVVNVSIDGVGEIQNKTRIFRNGSGTYSYVERGIEIAKKYGILSHFVITVNKYNVKNLLPLVKKAINSNILLNIDFCKVYYSSHTQLNLKANNNDIISSLKKVYNYIYKIAQEKRFSPLKRHGLLDIFSLDMPKKKTCAAGTEEYFAVSCDGSVRACPVLQVKSCSIYEKDFINKLKKTTFVNPTGKIIKSECNKCLWKYRCGGGCPSEKYTSRIPLSHRSSYCEVYQSLIKHLLRLEAKRMIFNSVFNS